MIFLRNEIIIVFEYVLCQSIFKKDFCIIDVLMYTRLSIQFF